MLPKDLRHSFGTAALKASGDIYGVSKLMRHADIKTTLRYTEGAAGPREHAVIAAFTAATTGVEFGAKNFTKKDTQKRGRKAKGVHQVTQNKNHWNAQETQDLANDPMIVGEKPFSL